jgi:hypothetical protein
MPKIEIPKQQAKKRADKSKQARLFDDKLQLSATIVEHTNCAQRLPMRR